MKHRFLILGMPRSRTAWLSVWMTGLGARCVHDPTRWVKAEHMRAFVFGRHHETFGISDNAFGLSLEIVRRDFGGVPKLVVLREPHDSHKAVESRFVMDEAWRALHLDMCERLASNLSELTKEHDVLAVHHKDLSDVELLRMIGCHLIPHIPLDEEWSQEMIEKQVEIVPELYMRRS